MKTSFILMLPILSFAFITPEKEPGVDAIASETVINIKLNNGEKWEADPETTAAINTLQEICIRHYNEKTVDDELLKAELSAIVDKLNMVTKMTGNARSQLHNFQLGIRNRINTISQDRESVLWLTDYLERYFDYFETN